MRTVLVILTVLTLGLISPGHAAPGDVSFPSPNQTEVRHVFGTRKAQIHFLHAPVSDQGKKTTSHCTFLSLLDWHSSQYHRTDFNSNEGVRPFEKRLVINYPSEEPITI